MLVALGSLQGACYNYTPLGRSHLTPSTYLAVTLTEAGSVELAQYIGPNVLIIRGRFLTATDRGLVMSVAAVETRRGSVFEWKGESIVVPGEFVRGIEERQAAAGKTALLAGASLLGMVVAYQAFGPGSAGGSAGGGGARPPPP